MKRPDIQGVKPVTVNRNLSADFKPEANKKYRGKNNMQKYLIIGNGAAGTTAAETIRRHDSEGSIIIITDENLPFYSRLRLNEYIEGKINKEKLIIKKEKWYQDNNIELMPDTRIIDADPKNKTVLTKDGKNISYDRLLVATGSHSFVPPIKGSEKKGVFTLRNIKNAENIIKYADTIDDVVIIGGGLLGIEVGYALLKSGKKVLIVEFFPRLLPRQLDDDGAKRLRIIMEDIGFSFRLDAKTKEVAGKDQAEDVLLENGETLPAKMVIISAGVRPNLNLAESLRVHCDKGIVVDDHMKTDSADIYAAGDVAEFENRLLGIWPAAMDQGKAAGLNMAGADMIYKGTTMSNTLKVAGIDLASAGDIDAENRLESEVFTDNQVYKKLVIDNDKIVGCIMLGDKKGFNKITRAMSEKKNVSHLKDQILSKEFNFERL